MQTWGTLQAPRPCLAHRCFGPSCHHYPLGTEAAGEGEEDTRLCGPLIDWLRGVSATCPDTVHVELGASSRTEGGEALASLLQQPIGEGEKAATEKALAEDKKYLAELKAECEAKRKAFEERQATRESPLKRKAPPSGASVGADGLHAQVV